MNKIIDSFALLPDRLGTQFRIKLPSKCPCCDIAYAESPLTSYHVENDADEATIYSLYFCPHCEKCFLVEYYIGDGYSSSIRNGYDRAVYPTPAVTTVFADNIKQISSKFVEIYHQAEISENAGLSEICGIGYRKALEFLVKDYAISLHSDKKDQIESAPLSQCVSNYINDERIKTLATASIWLGNDETHYVRKHHDYNLDDLKRFINTVVSYIEFDLNYAEAASLLSRD